MIFIRRSSFICSLFLVTCLLLVVSSNTEEDLYKLLGVSRSASAREIKKAYRKKALDTHPDKNKDVSPEVAAAAFHKVVHAFEILSDSSSRQRYDRTGRTDTNGGGGNPHQQRNARNFQWTFRWNTNGRRREKPKLKDRFDVKESQSRILHIVSLEQLETIITNDDGVLERNLLICFYTPPLEKLVMEEMVYPWPFAGMSSQGIWWEDLLQTTVVRYHNSNDLTEFFGIPRGGDLKEPKFVFGKRGQVFKDKNAWSSRFETNDREKFDKWVWQQLEVPIKFVNNHDHPVELYWIHERVGHVKGIIEPGETRDHTTMLSHEWFVRDARTDTRPDSPNRNKLSEETCLFRTKILSDVQVEYVIPKRNCYDLSGHCSFWNRVRAIGFDRYGRPIQRQQRECDRNPNFMHEICRRTCGKCQLDSDKEETDENDRKNNSESKGSDEL